LDALQLEFLGITVARWLVGLGAAVATFAALRVAVGIVSGRIERLAGSTSNNWDDALVAALRRTHWILYLAAALYASAVLLRIQPAQQALKSAVPLAFLLQCGLWANTILAVRLDAYRKRKSEEDPGALTHLGAVRFVGHLLVWTVVLLMVLDNLGVKIGPIIAGLGVGGIAVALAVQNILGDLFASLSIVLDKPFVVGDFLIVDNYLGKVERVGLKTTRIRSLSGEQLIFSNNDLLKSRLRNYGRMYERRVVFNLGVVYQTRRELLERIPGIIRHAIEAQDDTRFDRSHFREYGDFSLNFETVYFVLSPDYNRYMDIQQAINLKINEVFEREGIEFAYPTQTLFVASAQGSRRPEAQAGVR
jgi:small-conductance mechanosensitive channel